MKEPPYEIPGKWNPAGSARGREAAARTQREEKRRRGRPAGSRNSTYRSRDAGPPQPINQEALDPRFSEIDRLIKSGQGDVRPGKKGR